MVQRIFECQTRIAQDTNFHQGQYLLRLMSGSSFLGICLLTSSIILFVSISARGQAVPSFAFVSDFHGTQVESIELGNNRSSPERVADTPQCTFFLPAMGYSYDADLKHGVKIGLQMAKAARNCDCTGPWGGLCFFVGTTYELNAAYFPSTKTTEGSLGFRYRYIFFAGGLTGGYASSSEEGLPQDHFFIRPTLALDLLVGQITVGYTIRTEEMDESGGSFRVGLTLSPFSLNNSSAYRSSVKRVMKSTKAERSELRQSLRN